MYKYKILSILSNEGTLNPEVFMGGPALIMHKNVALLDSFKKWYFNLEIGLTTNKNKIVNRSRA
jgi:hypothetical protein